MADDITFQTTVATPPSGAVVATDDVGGKHYQKIKVALGAENAVDTMLDSGQQTMTNSVPVVVASDQSAVPVSASSLPLPAGASTSANQSTIIGHLDGVEGLLTTIDADTSTLAGAVSGSEMQVDLVAALPAGNNNIGDVDIASLPNEGQQTMANSISVAVASDQSAIPVSATSLPLPTGAATSAKQDTQITELQDIETDLEAINTKLAAAKTADYDTGAGTDTVQMVGVALPASGGAVAGGTASNPLRTDPTGSTVQPVSASSLPLPAGAATLAEQQTQSASLSVLDDWDESDRAKVNLIAGQAGITAGAGTVGASTPRVTLASDDPAVSNTAAIKTAVELIDNAISGSEMQVDVVASLPAGTNNIGDVDVLSVVPGTGATNLGKAEDAAHTSGDVGVMALGVRNDAGSAFGADGDYVPLSVDSSGAVRVTGGGGGTQYTEGDTDSTITGTAMLWEDSSDTLRSVSAAKPLPVNIVAGSSSGTEYTEDAAAAANPAGGAVIVVRDDARSGSLTSADGDNVALRGTNAGELYVKHVDSVAVTHGALTELAAAIDTEVQCDIVGPLPAGTNAIGKLAANSGVDIGDVDVTSITPGAGASNLGKAGDAAHSSGDVGVMMLGIRNDVLSTLTSADGDYSPVVVDNAGRLRTVISGTSAATQSGIWSTRTLDGNGNQITSSTATPDPADRGLHVRVVDDPAQVDDAAFTPGTSRVMMAGFEFDDISPDSVNEGDGGAARMSANRNVYTQIRDAAGNERGANVNASNQLSVSVDNTVTVASHAVTNAGTFATQVTGDALTALQLIDDAVFAEDVAANAGDKGLAILAVRRDADTSLVGADNDYANLQVNANGALKVEVFDGGDSHTVDDGGGSLTVDGTVTANAGTGTFTTTSVGTVADDATTPGAPVMIGGQAKETDGTDPGSVSAEDDVVRAIFDRNRRQLVNTAHPNLWKVNENHSSAQTNNQLKAAPGANLSLYITDVIVSNGATAGTLKLVEDEGGTPADICGPYYMAINGGAVMNFTTPIRLTANKSLGFTSTSVTTHTIQVHGYTAP